MRAALWLITLFALAAAGAWMAGNNQGTVTLFWFPHRIDLSLNLAVLVVLLVVLLVILAQRALSAFLALPQRAQRWRLQQKERASHAALLDSMGHLMAGRFLRARKAAEQTLAKEALLQASGVTLDHAVSLRTLAHIMAAEASHALQDKTQRQQHLDQALAQLQGSAGAERQTLLEGTQLRAARWSLDDRDATASLARLSVLPPAVGRRMAAMRLQLKAARLAGQPDKALETASLLAKHRAFSPEAAESLVTRLILDLLDQTHDPEALQRIWKRLTPSQRLMPFVAAEAALRCLQLGGSAAMARLWLQDLWIPMQANPSVWSEAQLLRVVQAFDACLPAVGAEDAFVWLSRMESAQQSQPRAAHLQYLAGMLCLRQHLWGKAQSLLAQAVKNLQAPVLQRKAWMALAELAQQRQDPVQAAAAWKEAAMVSTD
ncbi:heme biosynthesis protein HemY [Limnohabitans sp. Bal53]|uniref:heme biosynthesis protein HemY n=1 Tax=Limnohabitans sp. Bal53 TaxID=1977910 RepID=UPI000D3ADCCA|nr:heme biosynthesis HemY N-terminal domain-containing protein [Limnohabitans sp. Bal53]PUE42590.1 heme biosynthesis protein HemY [Limnohabitans sp. Bal53]